LVGSKYGDAKIRGARFYAVFGFRSTSGRIRKKGFTNKYYRKFSIVIYSYYIHFLFEKPPYCAVDVFFLFSHLALSYA
jgi:hypothetical protein